HWTRLTSRRVGRRTILRGTGIAAAGAAGVALVGCGDDSSGSSATKAPSSAASAGASASAAPSTAAQPRKGGQITYPIGGEPATLDVHRQSTAYITGYGPGAAYSQLIRSQSF